MLELRNIQKTYYAGETSTAALRGVSLKFGRSEFTSILGPSGCGKTTLLNIIGGLDQYDDGDLIIDGVSTKRYKDHDWDTYRNYRVGFIFQSYNLIMHQSVEANVEMALTLSGVSKSERKKRADEALVKVGLGDQIDKKPTQLSGGQMQRVAIARALVNDPEIILADEPTGALDSVTSIQIMDLLKEIAKDKLVIMVTHNPDLARQYSTRIIELKDGVVTGDSNPYTGEEEHRERITKSKSMSMLTALGLSFRNLLTKKGRTLLTAFAGSIGIIGIALVLSLSNGVNEAAKGLEQETLADYPITIERSSFDLSGLFSAISSSTASSYACEAGKICSADDIVSVAAGSDDIGLLTENDLKSFKAYIEANSDEFAKYTDEIDYSYSINLQVYNSSLERVSPSPFSEDASETLFKEILHSQERLENMYTVLAGKFPENRNETVLVIGSDNTIRDSMLYALGIKDKKQLNEDLAKAAADREYKVEPSAYAPEDFIGRSYTAVVKADYYAEENGKFVDKSADAGYMKEVIANGEKLTIVGVIQLGESADAYIGYTDKLTEYMLGEVAKTDIYKAQTASPDVSVITGEAFDDFFYTYDDMAGELGLAEQDDPSEISIYPNDYKSKEAIVNMIDTYNAQQTEAGNTAGVIRYTDMMSSMLSGVTNVISIVSYILIAFIAISLVVSSIMIGIITYISVLERTREIGILRAIGASKKDVVRVFRAETIIEGLAAGLIGIGLALLINMAVNAVLKFFDYPALAVMPVSGAVILILLSVFLNLIAGQIPSRMAAKKNPVEALRTE